MGVDLEALLSSSARGMRRSLIRELLKLTSRGGIISFAGGFPDPATFPVADLQDVTRDILADHAHTALQYGITEGDPRLRDELARWMVKDGISAGRDEILITTGSQQGLDITAKVFLDPGDLVIVELPSYMAGLQVFRTYGAEMIGVPQDDEGMDTDRLAEVLARLAREGRRPKFIYAVPDFQNPSGVTWTEARRRALLALARRYTTLVLEDNPYREIRFEGSAPPPIYALDEDKRTIYLSTFSKTLAPGLRIGWMVAREEITAQFVTAKQAMDLCSPAFTQAVAAEMLARGIISGRLDRIAGVYRRKRDAMLRALSREMPEGVTWTRPEGGLFLWVRLPEGMDTEALLPEAVEREKVAYVIGSGFFANGGGKHTMRLNFSYPSEEDIDEGIRRLARLIRRHLPVSTSSTPERTTVSD
ncbi:MAG TPA: PLP-dependent aminotransferase family protein [bacterium]|jgi:2-aminoadipate transaminase|nr:PLP-dependent aminotransferase family protein [bacterium]